MPVRAHPDTMGLSASEYAEVSAAIAGLPEPLQASLRDLHQRLAVEIARGKGRGSPLTSADKRVLRQVGYAMHAKGEFASVPLKALDLLLIMAVPPEWVAEAQKRLGQDMGTLARDFMKERAGAGLRDVVALAGKLGIPHADGAAAFLVGDGLMDRDSGLLTDAGRQSFTRPDMLDSAPARDLQRVLEASGRNQPGWHVALLALAVASTRVDPTLRVE